MFQRRHFKQTAKILAELEFVEAKVIERIMRMFDQHATTSFNSGKFLDAFHDGYVAVHGHQYPFEINW